MKIGRNMILAVLLTFCMTATLVIAIPIRSATSPYDPWVDINGDDKISLQDLVLLANSYGTTNTENLTRNVNVTNWPYLPPEPKMVLCYSSFVYWSNNGFGAGGPMPPIYIGDYSKVTIFLNLTNVHINYSSEANVRFGASLVWSDPESGIQSAAEVLSSPLLNLFAQTGYSQQIGIGSFAIKAPYMQLEPWYESFYTNSQGNGTFSIYAYLSDGTAGDAKLETLSTVVGYPHITVNQNSYYADPIYVTGYRQVTITVFTNVSCDVAVYCQSSPFSGGYVVDSFATTAYAVIAKTYDVTSEIVNLHFYSPTTPYEVFINAYMTC